MTERWSWLAASHRASSIDGGAVTIEETKDPGRAEVTFAAPSGWTLEKLALDRCAFDWLDGPQVADGVVLARAPGGKWKAHVVECKRTVTDAKWTRVQKQLRGSCMRVMAVAGAVGIEIEQFILYTAFRQDQLGRRSTDAILTISPAGEPTDPASPAARRVAWHARTLLVEGLGMLEHRRIQLTTADDDVGRAEILLH
jgi:hypothetical protein